MKESIIETHYSANGKYRFEVVDRKNGTFHVRVASECYDEYADEFYWSPSTDMVHITDTVERALEIGNELMSNFTGTKQAFSSKEQTK